MTNHPEFDLPRIPELDFGQGMPASVDAERSVLGAILLDNPAFNEAAARLRAEEFSLRAHQLIFATMASMVKDGKHIDLVTLSEYLTNSGQLGMAGGVVYISSITDGLPRRSSIAQYVEIIKAKFDRRSMIYAFMTGTAACLDHAETNREILSIVSDRIMEIESNSASGLGQSFSDVNLLEVIKARMHADRKVLGYTFGIDALDTATTGMRDGELVIVGGLPSKGKTAFLINVLLANCRASVPAVMFSLEMTKESVGMRILAILAGIPAGKVRNPLDMTSEEYQKLEIAHQELQALPLIIDDKPDLTIEEICARARLYIARHKVRLIALDFMQLTDTQERGLEAHERIAWVGRHLRLLARQTGTPVLALSQLTPESKDENIRPALGSLRGSADPGQLAHMVLFVCHPKDDQRMPIGLDEIIIAKQREGMTGIIPVYFDVRAQVWSARQATAKETPKAPKQVRPFSYVKDRLFPQEE